VLTEQSLSEAVILLQRRDLAPEIREIVEEAAGLLTEDRDGEARALLEKAEALAALEQPLENASGTQQGEPAGNGADVPDLRALAAPLAARLAEGFTGVLTGVLEEIHRYAGDQVQVATQALQQHIDELDTAICDLVVVGERQQERANEQQVHLEGVRQSQEAIRSSIAALQHAGQEQTEAVRHVTTATEELSRRMTEEVEAVASRFVSLEERVGLLDQFALDLPAQLSEMVARLDGHTETLRLLEQRQSHRVSTLNQVLDSLARLREPETPELTAMPAVA
jgi:hypothetical protein